ncbi:MAG TPA: CpsD/CapB family tyrosine-protein kinase [Deltaproteobacteria bacterium]|nr:CpsD/CapB family tyrosine-protein kinase [Deltaproteobacteria bacterium]HPR54103.1 CpsD/CapB family tyrosine-protein kinase [Deltaproteobacteria bacterium]HXK47051.1 CpsD/CapB family tyrosine-protein kinase [Deltaproteobacteria bacterium]
MHILKALEKQDQDFVKDSGATGPLDDHLYMHHMPYSYTAEQIRKLRTFIFHMPDRPVPRVIMVTSALPGEGKSVIASNLAVAIAKGEDQQVLLVDCDLRKPSLHELFKYPRSKGVSEILQGRADISECIVNTSIDKLMILPAAKEPPANPSELLESRKTSALIQNLAGREGDWFIIIDTSPIQATVDPKILSDVVDGIVMVVRYRYTREAEFKMALEALPKEKIIGTVLNGVDELPVKKYTYRKYKYYKNYYNR